MTEQSQPSSPGGRTDAASRLIRATPEVVYQALVDPSALVRWLPPTGMTGHIDAFDPCVGGEYRITLTYDRSHQARGKTTADTDVTYGRFLELVPNHSVVQSVRFESHDPAFAGEMRLGWFLGPRPEGTLVHVRAENVPEGITPEAHAAGFQATLANLAAFVEE